MEHVGEETPLRYRIDFDELSWEAPMTGVRHKQLHQSGLCIPPGPDHRHRATVRSGRALVFFVEPA